MASRSSRYEKDNKKLKGKNKKIEPQVYEAKHGDKVTEEVVIVKRKKLKVFNIFLFICILLVTYIVIYFLLQIPITNIYISGNTILKDQEIIELAGIEDYPSTLKYNFFVIKKKLEKNKYILNAKVRTKWFTQVYIEVTENLPLYYYVSEEKTVLTDGSLTDDELDVPALINYVPDKVYALFVQEYKKINRDVTSKISEIKYDPNDVDDERFYLTMTDGNCVYLTLDRFEKLDSYLTIIKNFENKKGTLYLDSGEYFEVR